ncbi:helix-turn-helix domain-containing protein [Phreatobacter stygius]|uniref:Helix-turn-helix transcriptional regulator n=2 Tax=Pseudomonadota TaxID=1224 RepID=A0A4D7BID9_9HYPH|nr:helix-turn-helix transcriptional regulator [Phreatobacter stygius]QCI67612.1 helix-turn-helix transcriptional regulator [Phreatobacter stygius]
MAIDYVQIGQRLRAHRMGLNLSPEEAAERLGVSRAALYNYEKGASPVKVETLERMAVVLGVSLPSLLGVGTEYFSSAIAYFERLRQIETASERVLVYYEPVTFLITSQDYPASLRRMLTEGLPEELPGRAAALAEIDRLLGVLAERRALFAPPGPNVASIVGATQVRRLLRTGLIGSYNLSDADRDERRALAAREVELVAALMENEPVGVQIGVVDDTLPNQTFEICRLKDGGSLVAVSPFRLGELPNVRLGVASITGAPEAVALYERLAAQLWQRAAKGVTGAALLRRCIAEAQMDESKKMESY